MVESQIKQGEHCNFIRAGQMIRKYVPQSSAESVIIPSNIKGTGFFRNTFGENREHIGGIMSREEYDEVVNKASKMTAHMYSQNRIKDVEGVGQKVIYLLGLCSFFLLLYVFLVYYGVRDDDERLIIAGFTMLGISFIVATVLSFMNFFARPDRQTPFNVMVKRSLNSYFEKVNRKYGARGVEWTVIEDHYWLEVRINSGKAAKHR